MVPNNNREAIDKIEFLVKILTNTRIEELVNNIGSVQYIGKAFTDAIVNKIAKNIIVNMITDF